jgi:hypothetical protein
MPLADYWLLCAEAVANLPSIIMAPYLVTDGLTSKADLTRSAFRFGSTFGRITNEKHSYFMAYSNGNARRMSAGLGTPNSSSNVQIDLLQVASKITTVSTPRVVVLPDSLVTELHPRQQKWMSEGIYLVFGFCDLTAPFNQNLNNAIGTALVLLDRHIIEANSYDPRHHRPLTVSAQAAADFQCVVGDVYQNRIATWHWTLALLQIGLSVCYRASYDGKSPTRTMRRFASSGHQHHVLAV